VRTAGRAARRAVAASLLLALCGEARAQFLRATIEPTYSHRETESTDQTGRTTETVEDRVTQRYYLTLDRELTRFLSTSVGATLLDDRGWIGQDDVWRDGGGRATTFFGRLTLGGPVLNAGIGATRQEQRAYPFTQASSVSETYYADAVWRPRDLPELDVRVGRVNAYDSARLATDTTSDSASFGARYRAEQYDLRYILSWNRTEDHLGLTRTTLVEQTVLASRSDRLFRGRTATYVSGRFQDGSASTEREGEGGLVTRQQLPFSGLSAIEVLPATALEIELSPNQLLIDGSTTASAGVNVGFGPTASGDRDTRDVGVGFADAITPVNTIHVYVDREMSAPVGAALSASVAVYRSDDNRFWTPVPVVTPPTVSTFENRIEIGITETQARFLKVTLVPLALGVTTEPAFSELFVTELRTLLVLPAALVPSRQHTRAASVTGTIRTLILRGPDLSHDGSFTVSRRDDGPTTWMVSNGLSLSHRLNSWLVANARGARLDQDLGIEREGEWQWNAGLVARPVPAAQGTLTYSGQLRDTGELTNSLSALARADWYEGISTQANATVSITTEDERTTRGFQTSGRASLTPNRWVSLSAGGQYSWSLVSTVEGGDVMNQSALVDGSVALKPFPAASATGTVSRVLIGTRPTTLGTVQLNYFPLRGDLQLAFAYSKTLDTAAEATTELFSPTLRWNIRRGVSLRSSYTYLRNEAPVLLLVSRGIEATLLITL
jgi:hypothetical protein